MKHIKKITALMLAMVLAFAMSITVFAEAPTSGTITVSPNYKDQTYTLYKLFDAHITWKEDGTVRAITYTIPGKETTATTADLGAGFAWFKVNENHFVEPKDSTVTTDWAKDPAAIAWAESFGTKVQSPIKASSDNDTAVKWENLDWGYYFVKTTLGSFIGVDSTQPNATIQDKNEKPSVDKEIVSTTSGVVGNDPAKTAETDTGTKEAATAQVGDTVTYKVTVKAKAGAENYVVTDTLSTGLTPPAASGVTVTGLASPNDYTVAVSGQKITVTFTKAYLDSIEEDTDLVINYTAVLNGNAVVGQAGNPNTVKLTWGHDNEDNYSEDDAKVYTAKISVIKNDGNSQGLAGAEFALKNSDGKYYALANGVVSWVTSVDDATKFTSDDTGKLSGDFTGLPNGSYTLEETVVPDGYNPVDPADASLKFTIAGNDYTDENLIQSTTVVNNAGATLPTTGGIGTTIFYIIGAILVVGAGVLLVTRRRMNAA